MSIVSNIVKPVVSSIVKPIVSVSVLPNPIFYMPLTTDLSIPIGTGPATFTRSTVGTYIDPADDLLKTAAIDSARFESNGVLIEGASTNFALHSRDFANAAHVKTSITALKDAVGLDGAANSASTLTATAANGTVFQTITKTSAQNTYSIDVRRKTGTGVIELSDNGGSTYTDITASINSSNYTRFQITTTQANPSIGLRIVTSGDEVEVDYSQLEQLPFASSRIETTTIAVTRAADMLSVSADNIPAPNLDYSASVEADTLGQNGSTQRVYSVIGEANRIISANQGGSLIANNGAVAIVNPPIISSLEKVAVTGDASDAVSGFKLYRGGVFEDSIGFAVASGTKTSIQIGMRNSVDHLYGHIKNLRIFDIALDSNQVSRL